jgi:hypothetical protein
MALAVGSGNGEPCKKPADDMLYLIDCASILASMRQMALTTHRLDRVAISVSGLCMMHCLASAVLVGLLASAGGLLGAPLIHEVGLSLAMVFGALALGKGVVDHGFMMPSAVGSLGLGVMGGALTLPHDGSEALYTVIGVSILALGHRLNLLAAD